MKIVVLAQNTLFLLGLLLLRPSCAVDETDLFHSDETTKDEHSAAYCDILFPFDDIPNNGKQCNYVMLGRTGPLRKIIFCPKHPQGPPELLESCKLRGRFRIDDHKWINIQKNSTVPHEDNGCFKIPVTCNPGHIPPHHILNLTAYHLVFMVKGRKPCPRKPIIGPQSGGELRMLAKCSEAMD